MESLDLKPDLSLLKREPNAVDLGNQPTNKLRRTDNIDNNSSSPSRPQSCENEGENHDLSARIKIESNESAQVENPAEEPEQDESVNTDLYSAVQFESAVATNFNVKQEPGREKGQVSHGNKDSASSAMNPNIKTELENDETLTSPSESSGRVKCQFAGCKVICLNAEALERHNNSRHVAQVENGNNKINESSDVIYSSTPPPITTTTTTTTTNKNNNNHHHRSSRSVPSTLMSTQESEKTNKNNGNASSSSSSAKNKRVEKSPSKFTCTICNEQFKDDKKLYKHKFHKHGILQVSSSTKDPSDSNSSSNSAPKESVDSDIMKNSMSQIPGVSSMNKVFKCPVTSCTSHDKEFNGLGQLQQHCLKEHRGQTFPWCGPDRLIKCPDKGIRCHNKLFNRQTVLENHLKQVHALSGSEAASAAAAVCCGGGGDNESGEDEDLLLDLCTYPNCSFSTLFPSDMNRHDQLHTGDILKFKCKMEDCGVAFCKQSTFSQHMNEIHARSLHFVP